MHVRLPQTGRGGLFEEIELESVVHAHGIELQDDFGQAHAADFGLWSGGKSLEIRLPIQTETATCVWHAWHGWTKQMG
jgi:hypothetical protein